MTRGPARTGLARRPAVFAAVLALLVASRGAITSAAPPEAKASDPNWPCQQIKIAHMSLATMWDGPSLDQFTTGWQNYPAAADLARRLAQRRVAVKDASAAIADFAKAAGADRKTQLLAFMGGLFALLDQERFEVVQGLDRFGARQQTYAAQIRDKITSLHEAQDAPAPDQSKIKTLTEQIHWDTQVFADRKNMISYACFVPDEIEHRLFQLAATTSGLLP